MDLDQARSLYVEGARDAGNALGHSPTWWPNGTHAQSEASAVAFATALAWAKRIPAPEQPAFMCLNLKADTVGRLVGDATRDMTATLGRLVRHLPGEALLDFALLPSHEALAAGQSEFALLTMESEMSPGLDVGAVATRRGPNTYAWDLAKLLWAPCTRRLFIARVGNAGRQSSEERRRKLSQSIDTLVRSYRGLLRAEDVLIAIVLPAAPGEWRNATLQIYSSGTPSGWAPLFP